MSGRGNTYTSTDLIRAGVDTRMVAFRLWRRARGLSLIEAGMLCGVNHHTLAHLEIGKRNAQHRHLCAIRDLMERYKPEDRPVRPWLKKRGRKPRAQPTDSSA